MFHIIWAWRKAAKLLLFCAGPSSVWQHHMLPRDVSEVNSLVIEKIKVKRVCTTRLKPELL